MIILKDLVTETESVFNDVAEAFMFASFLVSQGHEVKFLKGGM